MMLWFNGGWFLVGVITGVFVTIMLAVLAVASDEDRRNDDGRK